MLFNFIYFKQKIAINQYRNITDVRTIVTEIQLDTFTKIFQLS